MASIGYSTAKAALNIYSKILSKKFLKKKIDVKNLILGAFETEDNSFARLKKKNLKAYNDFKKKRLPLKRYAISEEIIPVIEFILSDKSNILSNELIIDNRELNTFRN
jgi:NAD(P)-dependent dehydrogenase (short-subunit alcohol dehydrogenase family)